MYNPQQRNAMAVATVHKQAITSEQVEHLFRSGQLGSCDSQDPAQLLRTSWFYSLLWKTRPRKSKKAYQRNACSPVNSPRPKVLRAQERGGMQEPPRRLVRQQRWIGWEDVWSPTFATLPCKNCAALLKPSESWIGSSFPTSQSDVNGTERASLVLQFSDRWGHAGQHDDSNVRCCRNFSSFDQPLWQFSRTIMSKQSTSRQ